MASDASDTPAQETAGMDAAYREAYDYWGYLIKPDKCGTELFDRLLKGIAEVIVSADRRRTLCARHGVQSLSMW